MNRASKKTLAPKAYPSARLGDSRVLRSNCEVRRKWSKEATGKSNGRNCNSPIKGFQHARVANFTGFAQIQKIEIRSDGSRNPVVRVADLKSMRRFRKSKFDRTVHGTPWSTLTRRRWTLRHSRCFIERALRRSRRLNVERASSKAEQVWQDKHE